MAFASDKGRQGAAGVSTGDYDIPNSCRFNDDDSAYLSRTFGTPTNRNIFTYSAWVKRGAVSTTQYMFFGYSANNDQNFSALFFESNDTLKVGGYSDDMLVSTQVFRDPSAWYHIVMAVDTTQSTASNRIKMYVNGEAMPYSTAGSYPTEDEDTGFNGAHSHSISGRQPFNGAYPFDGHMAEVNFIDGYAKDHTHFGETDATYGHWKAKKYTHSDGYGTNGFYLDFKLSADSASGLGNDASSNSNNWTPNNLDTYDQMLDSSTNNFSTLNPLKQKDVTLSEGNLKSFGGTGGSGDVLTHSTFGVSSGKWYAEFAYTAISGTSSPEAAYAVGIQKTESTGSTDLSYRYYAYWGTKYKDSDEPETYGVAYTAGDIIGIAFDAENGAVYFSKNGAWQSSATATEIANGTTTNAAFTGISGEYNFYGTRMGGTEHTGVWNFGQDSTFAGNETGSAGPYTDDNNTGLGDFYYTPPSGFLALCTKNLADPAVVPKDNFSVVTYTGDGTSPHAITNNNITSGSIDFKPDFTWFKGRGHTSDHWEIDSVRGITKYLRPNQTAQEGTNSDVVKSFDSAGFALGVAADVNVDTKTYVAWSWKAGGDDVLNQVGDIDSQVSANVAAGFSIVSYTGTGSTASVGHGLSAKPEMIIVKSRTSTDSWGIQHEELGATKYILFTTGAAGTATTVWGDTEPDEDVFTVGTTTTTNGSYDYIAYCFHSVDGYSKVGSYSGISTSGTDGTFVYLGFKPAYLLIKRYSSGTSDWVVFDNARDDANETDDILYPHLSAAEASDATGYGVDFVANGFKVKSSWSAINYTGYDFIYLAFAEHPFKYSTAR